MNSELTNDQILKHNKLHKQASDLLRGEILIDNKMPSPKPNMFARRRLHKAIALFGEVLKINPQNWAATFGMAKALQRLGETTRAFDLMIMAHRVKPTDSESVREAGIMAFQLGRFSEGIALSEEAIKLRPEDWTLYSNLGLGFLYVGESGKAIEAFRQSNKMKPSDSTTARLIAVAEAVQTGVIPCPHSEKEALQALKDIMKTEHI
jgi:tetratricopeptide (TPR) repeat protein